MKKPVRIISKEIDNEDDAYEQATAIVAEFGEDDLLWRALFFAVVEACPYNYGFMIDCIKNRYS